MFFIYSFSSFLVTPLQTSLIVLNEMEILLCIEMSIVKKLHEKLKEALCPLLGAGNSRMEY